MTIGKHFGRLALAAAATFIAACSSSTDTSSFNVSGVVQDLTLDADGLVTVVTIEAAPLFMTTANVVADGGQTATNVSVVGPTVQVTWDSRVTPSHNVRVVGVPNVDDSWRSVSSSDPSAPTFTITAATQDVSDNLLGGDTIQVTFAGPRVIQTEAEDHNNWDLEVNGQSLDLSGSAFSLNPGTQVLDITLDGLANLHGSFDLAATAVSSVSDTAMSTSQVAGAATGDAVAPTLTSITQNLTEDALGRVIDLQFDEPMDPVFAAIPANFTNVDHVDAIGLTLILSVTQPTDDMLRLTMSRPVAPGLDQLAHTGLMDAHGNAFAPATETIAVTPVANSFVSVTPVTVEGGADTVTIVTAQALDPDFAEDPTRWSMDIATVAQTMANQTYSYDVATQTLTITLDSDMVNGDAVDVSSVGQVDVDGDTFTVTATTALASGDAAAPTFVSAVQNRTTDPTGYTVDITFSEAIDIVEAQNSANYTFTPAATILSATRIGADNKVQIVTSDLVMTPGDVQVTIAANIQDLAGNVMAGPSGPNAMTSTDTTAPAINVVSAAAVEGADDDRVLVTFDDDMIEAEVENLANWTFESPVGTGVTVTGCTVDYNALSRTATLTLDSGGLVLKNEEDVEVSFVTMRDIAGNTVDASAMSATISGETNLPSVHNVWRQDPPMDGTLEIRFSEPCDNLDDLYAAGTNDYGTRFAIRDNIGVLKGYPHTATLMAGGLGVTLNYPFVINLTDTLDVIGAEDLAGNVMFPSMDTVIAAANPTAPAHSGAPAAVAVSGENNDQIDITFSEDMSPWRIDDPANYSVRTNPGGIDVPFGQSDISWDGDRAVTIHLGGVLRNGTNYDVVLEQDPSNPLRTEQGVAIASADTQTVAVSGDITTGPTQVGSTCMVDTTDPNSLIIVFEEAVDETAAEVPGNYDYNTGTIATSATLISPRVVRATFGSPVLAGNSVDIAQASTEDLAGNDSGGVMTLVALNDTTSPLLSSLSAVIVPGDGGDYIDIAFNEQVDTVTALDSSNYALDNGGTVSLSGSTMTYDSVTATVRIRLPFGSELDSTQGVTLTVSNVADAAGNVMPAPAPLGGSVTGDAVAPNIANAFTNYRLSPVGNIIEVLFDEDVDTAYIGAPANWSTSGIADISSVEVISSNHCILTLDFSMFAGETIDLDAGLTDVAGNVAAALSFTPVDPNL